ncbi:BA75_01804T0 [Komagataella pastoris]|uniref:BA75_01804T0 n=1 Tax=Komagataella pastoris TaxID=4922 RepID=A0A1B2J9E6_PICPA|nr:BA75_01804T0 [Komagataella pastoris]
MKTQKIVTLLCLLLSNVLGALLGIDYGQEFTKAVLVAPGVPFEVILTPDSKRKDNSMMAIKENFKGEIERYYGSAASSVCIRNPEACLNHLKSLIGVPIDDVSTIEYKKYHSGAELVPSKNNRNTVAFNLGSSVYPVEEILAMSLDDIKSRAEDHLKHAVPGSYSVINDAVITVPTFFTQSQRLALKDAAEISGLKVVGLVDDGISVAVNYASSRQFDGNKQYHMIYDMGAGSLQATLVSISSNEDGGIFIDVEAIAYDNSLGGQLFTQSVYDILLQKFLSEHPSFSESDFNKNSKSMSKLWQSAEKAKTILSANTDTRVSVESLYNDIDFRTTITRDEFEDYNAEHVHRITAPIIEALSHPLNENLTSPFPLTSLSSVILTGGSTRVPMVKKHLESLLGSELIAKNVNADESAVFGSTLRGVTLSQMFKARQMTVNERSVYDYCVKVGSSEINVFPVGTPLDTKKVVELENVDNGNQLTVGLYENGHLFANQEVSDLKKSIKSLTQEGKECSNIIYEATFELSESRLFSLTRLQAKCADKVESLPPVDTESDDAKSENSTSSENTEKSNKKLFYPVTIPTQLKFVHVKPMGSSTKISSSLKIKELNKKDAVKRSIEELKNQLESKLYRVRSYLEDEQVVQKGPASQVEALSTQVAENLEWLDYDSDDASAKDIRDKLNFVSESVSFIKNYIDLSDVTLDNNLFTMIYNTTSNSMQNVQELMLNMSEDALSLMQQYEKEGLDFAKESQKIKIKSPPLSDKELDGLFNVVTEKLEYVRTLTEEDGIVGLPREELFKLYQELQNYSSRFEEIMTSLKDVHSQRINRLTDKLNKHIERVNNEALKAALKEAKRQQEEEKSHEQNDEEEQGSSSTSHTKAETEEPSESPKAQTSHDEL